LRTFGTITSIAGLKICSLCKETEPNTGGADKSLARPGRKQATTTDDFDFHVSYLYS